MKSCSWRPMMAQTVFPVLLLALLLSNCATRPKIDWSSRIGSYTYDQAVTDMGPPEKSAQLSDGTLVTEWLTHRGYPIITQQGYHRPGGYYPYCPPWDPYYYVHYTPDYFLRLTFESDGQLKAWKKVIR